MNIKEQIEAQLKAAFEACGFDVGLATVSVSTVDICDYQCNAAFAIGKALKRPPIEVARQIAQQCHPTPATASAVAPAFINFTVTDEALSRAAEGILKTGKLPLAAQPKRTVFFDYGGANIAKELHVGHLRSPIVGEALKRVFEALGHKTVADVYLGDWGLQNGLILAELESRGYIDSAKNKKSGSHFLKPVTLDILNEVYPAASRRKDTEPAFKARADEITLKVQQKAEPWYGLWQEMRAISVAKIRENYNKLGCTFDFYNGESNAQPYVDTVLAMLKKKGLAYDDNNSLIMDVAEPGETAPMPPIILKKYNGGDLYATNDVATLFYRVKDFAPDEFVYITDVRQELHFRQVFRCTKRGGIVPADTTLTHIGYGTMNGTDGRPFKTRAGGTIKFEEVIGMVTEAAAKRLRAGTGADMNGQRQTEPDVKGDIHAGNEKSNSPDLKDGLAAKIGLAALKFADLSNNVRKDYIFDLEKFTSFEGKTGPYILYTIARINSIFGKVSAPPPQSGRTSPNFSLTLFDDAGARDILIKEIKLADAYPAAAANYTLNGIADAAYNLASAFNLFYAGTNISRESDPAKKQARLSLCRLTQTALKQAMQTLAIDVVDRM